MGWPDRPSGIFCIQSRNVSSGQCGNKGWDGSFSASFALIARPSPLASGPTGPATHPSLKGWGLRPPVEVLPPSSPTCMAAERYTATALEFL
jgi:hypothetical protein